MLRSFCASWPSAYATSKGWPVIFSVAASVLIWPLGYLSVGEVIGANSPSEALTHACRRPLWTCGLSLGTRTRGGMKVGSALQVPQRYTFGGAPM